MEKKGRFLIDFLIILSVCQVASTAEVQPPPEVKPSGFRRLINPILDFNFSYISNMVRNIGFDSYLPSFSLQFNHKVANGSNIDYDQLFKVIPIKNPEDQPNVDTIKKYIMTFVSVDMASGFDSKAFKNQGPLLRNIFEKLLVNNVVKENKKMYALIEKYLKIIQTDGEGAKAVVYTETSKPTLVSRTVNMSLSFRALDIKRIQEDKCVDELSRVIQFIVRDFNPAEDMGSFKYAMYTTRGEFLTGFFVHLKTLKKVDDNLKTELDLIKKYILLTGEGAAKVDYMI